MTEEWGAILVVDDDADMRELAHDMLKDRGHKVATAGSGEEALKRLAEEDYAVVLTDLRMKGMQGIELLAQIKRGYADINVILMTAFGSVETAVEAMKHGASDYLTKPVKKDELVRVVERVIREASLRREVSRLRKEVHKEYSFHQILGKSKAIQAVFDLIRRVADGPTNVLITGESGTGKELVAKAIHYNSDRKEAPFIPVNCAAIPEQLLESELFGHMRGAFTDAKADKRGLFEEAQKGTLFLDEISELPLMLQAKVLRAIEQGEVSPVGSNDAPLRVDVRLICATNRNLAQLAKEGRFREDLYFRVSVVTVELPPLRTYKDNLEILAQVFLQQAAKKHGRRVDSISKEAMALLQAHDFPGNMRELKNALEHAVILTSTNEVRAEDLPKSMRLDVPKPMLTPEPVKTDTTPTLEEMRAKWVAPYEKQYLQELLVKTKGQVSAASKLAGVNRVTFYRLMEKHGLRLARMPV